MRLFCHQHKTFSRCCCSLLSPEQVARVVAVYMYFQNAQKTLQFYGSNITLNAQKTLQFYGSNITLIEKEKRKKKKKEKKTAESIVS